MEQERLFIEMSSDVRQLLADNSIDLVGELRKQGLEVEKAFAPAPISSGQNQTRDPTMIILASSALFGAISIGISKIIDALSRRPVVVTSRTSVPLINPTTGEIVRDTNGQPILQWEEKPQVYQMGAASQKAGDLTASVGGDKGLKISLS